MDKRLSVGIRIDRVTPSHVYCALFCAMAPEEQSAHVTRELSGALVFRPDEFGPFLERIQPDALFASDDVALDYLERVTLVGLRVKKEDAS